MNKTLKILLIAGGVVTATVGAVFAVQKVRVLMDEQADADSDRAEVSYSRPIPKIVKKPTRKPIPIKLEISEDDDE